MLQRKQRPACTKAKKSGNRWGGSRLSRGDAKGFTVTELVVALLIIGVMAAIVAPFGEELVEDYRFRGMLRSFVSAMHMARIQAVDNRALIEIANSQTAGGGEWVKFTSDQPHGLTSDTNPQTRVMMSGLDCHTGMNGNEYVVSYVDDTHFQVEFKWDLVDGACGADTTGYARNITAPSKLIVEGKLKSEDPAHFTSRNYRVMREGPAVRFLYNEEIYDVTVDGNDAKVTPQEIVFDSRGFTLDYLTHTVALRRKDTANPAKTEVKFSVAGNGRVASSY